MDRVECAVIGAGVIGLAVAQALARAGREVVILERADRFGTGISSRNSEVIHAGLYYQADSLKARFCVAGQRELYAYCRAHGVGHSRCGKLIVATTEDQRRDLADIAATAARNGVSDIRAIDAAEATRMAPGLYCLAALHSPSSGVIDATGYMRSLLGDAESSGAVIAYGAAVSRMRIEPGGVAIWMEGEDAPSLMARLTVNAAGLDAAPLTHRIEGLDPGFARPSFYAKGNYFTLAARSPFSQLIYPVPEPGGLGVHLTLDLGGQARFGPDVEWVDAPSYDVAPARGAEFYTAIRRYWPGLPDGALVPAYAGVRPKLAGPGQPAADFAIEGSDIHDARGLINLLGIESPGLTSSLAIADYVKALAEAELAR